VDTHPEPMWTPADVSAYLRVPITTSTSGATSAPDQWPIGSAGTCGTTRPRYGPGCAGTRRERRQARRLLARPVRGPDGRQRQRSFRRKIDAERWLAEQQARLTWGEWVDPAASRVSFGAVASEWLDAAVHLKPKTRASYSSLLRTRVLPTWERISLGRITHEGVAWWVAGMATAGLSPSRIRQAVDVVSAVCDYAIRTDRLIRNPARGVRLPRMRRRSERRSGRDDPDDGDGAAGALARR